MGNLLRLQVETVEFRNFELGVLFHSSSTRGVEYRAFHPNCPIHQLSSISKRDETTGAELQSSATDGAEIVLLPAPYDLVGGQPYYSVDSATFLHRPYLTNTNEVPSFCFHSPDGYELMRFFNLI